MNGAAPLGGLTEGDVAVLYRVYAGLMAAWRGTGEHRNDGSHSADLRDWADAVFGVRRRLTAAAPKVAAPQAGSLRQIGTMRIDSEEIDVDLTDESGLRDGQAIYVVAPAGELATKWDSATGERFPTPEAIAALAQPAAQVVPPGYMLIGESLLREWGKLYEVRAACTFPVKPAAQGGDGYSVKVRHQGEWSRYPIGTRAYAFDGGYWQRVEHGWKWCTGSTFPTPGADAREVAFPAALAPQRSEDSP